MKINGKLTLPVVLGVISLLTLSLPFSPILNSAVKAQQLSQQLSQLGINGSNLQSLKQEGGGPDFAGLVQKLQNPTDSRGGGQ